MSTWTHDEQVTAMKGLMERSAADAAFREMALKNPEAALKDVSGKELPEGFSLRCVSNEGADLTLVLPDPASSDLSDGDLEAVSGGKSTTFVPIPI